MKLNSLPLAMVAAGILGSAACAGPKSPPRPIPQVTRSCDLPKIRDIAFQEGWMHGQFSTLDQKAANPIRVPSGSGWIRGPFSAADQESCKSACAIGELDSCVALGIVQQFGTPAGRDPIEAVKIFEQQCQNRSVVGCTHLGLAALMGLGLLPDTERGASLTERACKDGDAWACIALADWYASGEGIWKNEKASREWAERACKSSSPEGCVNLGVLLVKSADNESSVQEGITLLRRACDARFGRACLELGNLGTGKVRENLKFDPARIRRLYEDACDRGSMMGCTALGKALVAGEFGDNERSQGWARLVQTCIAGFGPACAMFKKEPAAVLTQLQTGCSSDSPVHCWHLGRLRGFIDDPQVNDVAQAREALTKACNAGEVEACVDLGTLRFRNDAIGRDVIEGRIQFDQACRAGIGDACLMWIAATKWELRLTKGSREMLENGERGCRLGDVTSCQFLAMAYQQWDMGETGTLVSLLEYGCNHGIAQLCTNSSMLLAMGSRLPPNLPRALEFARRGCAGGSDQGCENAVVLEAQRKLPAKAEERVPQYVQQVCAKSNSPECTMLALIGGFRHDLINSDAVKQLEVDCSQRRGQACSVLASMFFLGKGGAKDTATAIAFTEKACDLGEGDSCANLGLLFREGTVVRKDRKKEIDSWARSCVARFAAGCVELGRACWPKPGEAKPIECKLRGKSVEASVLLDEVCAAGEADGCEALGDGYATDSPPNPKAEDAYGRGCGARNGVTSCRKLGQWLLKANRPKESIEIIEKALRSGDTAAHETARTLYRQGWFAQRKAAETFIDACNKGDHNACHVGGVLLTSMEAPTLDDDRLAANLFKIACESGRIGKACTWYGQAQICGNFGVMQNEEAGVALLHKTCENAEKGLRTSNGSATSVEPRSGDMAACGLRDQVKNIRVSICAK